MIGKTFSTPACRGRCVLLQPIEADALQELADIATRTCATTMATMLGTHVNVVGTVRHLEISALDLARGLGVDGEQVVTASIVKLAGELRGAVLLVFPGNSARDVAARLTQCPPQSTLGELERSSLKELANVTSDRFTAAFYAPLALHVRQRVPMFAVAPWSSMLKYAFLGTASGGVSVWFSASTLDVGASECVHAILLVDAADVPKVAAAVVRRLEG